MSKLLDFLTLRFIHRQSVLVLEDDPFLRPLFIRTVERVNPDMEVEWAANLTEARECLKRRTPSLIIADCLLEKGETGLALWEECQRHFSKIPFVMISGLSEPAIAKLCGIGKKTPELLRKPFLPIDLESIVEKKIHSAR